MKQQDFSLLVVFDAIMTQGSITRAADSLAITQPAVSNALARMRVAWNDELFVKDGRNVSPTPYAVNLWKQISDPMQKLDRAVSPSGFDPATAQRSFYIAAADIGINAVWHSLRAIIEKEAPGIDIYAVPYTIVNCEELLNYAKVDLVLGSMAQASRKIDGEILFKSRSACVMRAGHPLAKKSLTIEEYCSADHLMVSLSGDTSSMQDDFLKSYNLQRRIAMTVNHFSSVGSLLLNSDLIGIAPTLAVEKEIFNGDLIVVDIPIELYEPEIACYYHQRQMNDAGLIWLRQQISSIAKNRMHEHFLKLDQYLNL
ncbi:MAG: LysR family transcriptional regulator [Arenicella sp.]